MSRKDFLFFNDLGNHYLEDGLEKEKTRDYESASRFFQVGFECFKKADEIATQDYIVQGEKLRSKGDFCLQKSKIMTEKLGEIQEKLHHKSDR
jgi:hypothetical protein